MVVNWACEWKHPRAPTIRLLFQDGGATPAVLIFLRDTRVGKTVALAPPGEEEWDGLEEIELWPEGGGQAANDDEGGPGPP